MATLVVRQASHMPRKASQQQLMRAASLLVTLIALAVFSASCGGGAIEHVSTTANPPAVSLCPLGLNFGSQPLESSSRAQPITLSNIGGGVVTISGVALSGDFTQTNNCGMSANCTIRITFPPSRVAAR